MKRYPTSQEIIEAFKKYGGKPVRWCRDCTRYYLSETFDEHLLRESKMR